MTNLLVTGWTFYPSVLIGFGLWTTVYVFMTGPLRIRNGWGESPIVLRQVAFHVGTLIGLIALISPLDELGDEYLFSAHMIQHLLLMFITAPLWLIGTPGWLVHLLFPKSLGSIANRITRPLSAYAVFVVVMTLWHVPSIYNLALESEAVHIFEHLTFIGSALIGWWPVVGADNPTIMRPTPPIRMLYLFLLTIPMTALAAIMTFSSAPLYSFYIGVPHLFGLSALDDQHLGGLLMWLPTHMVIFLMLGITFLKWFADEEKQANALYSNSL